MAYDEQLANRIRQAFGTRNDITERKMFGGLVFLYRGRMCCGIVGRDLMVRIPDDEFDGVMRGRHLRGWLSRGGGSPVTRRRSL